MILALDQSLTATGYVVAFKGVIYEHGVIKTSPEKKKRNIGSMDDACRRTLNIMEELQATIEKHDIRAIVCEEYSGYSQSKASADALATARTIVVAVSYYNNIPMFFVSQNDVKRVFAVPSKASKTDCINAIAGYYEDTFRCYTSKTSSSGWKGETEHVADAIGVYLAGRKLPSIQMIDKD